MLGYRVGGFEHQFMHLAGLILFAVIALFWIFHGVRVALGAIHLPHLRDYQPLPDVECPSVSLLFSARDEEDKLPTALTTLRALDYPQLEIVAVNDRSTDATGRILDEAAAKDPRIKVVAIKDLPVGWLGKPHALQRAYEASRGEWLLFTDADVKFRPDAIRRAVAMVQASKADHMPLMCDIEMHDFWEKTVLTFFALGFYLGTNPPAVSNPKSSAYLGVGAFQLVRRSAYEASGTHRRLAMEVVDDIKLGKIVKQSGFRSAAGLSGDYVSVRWHSGLGNIVRGVTKNFFATAGFRRRMVAFQLAGVFCTNVLPFVALPFLRGWTLALAAASALMALAAHAGTAMVMGASPLYALTQPVGALIFDYMLLRSTVITLKQGGIVWRGTFYPLEELRRGLV